MLRLNVKAVEHHLFQLTIYGFYIYIYIKRDHLGLGVNVREGRPTTQLSLWFSGCSPMMSVLIMIGILTAPPVYSYINCSIVACHESIVAEGSRAWSPDSLTDASTLLLAVTTGFISALVITNECLQYLRGLTVSLQEEAKRHCYS